MKKEILESLIQVITGLSGGAAGLWLFWTGKPDTEEVTTKRALGFIGLGICGAYFIAPALIDYWSLTGGLASCVSFLSAVFADAILVLIYKALKVLQEKIEQLIDKYILRK